jgi:Zn ribbon nucleic-acid-binding protein
MNTRYSVNTKQKEPPGKHPQRLKCQNPVLSERFDSMSISQKHYRIGYELYIARQPISACKTANQVAGWLAANAAEAECATAGYADRMGW